MEISKKALETFEGLKAQNRKYTLKCLKRHYYLYVVAGRWDKRLEKTINTEVYQGRITEEGDFVPKRRSYKLKEPVVLRPKELIQMELETNALPEYQVARRQSSKKHETTLLTALSMNGRISLPALGRMLGLSVTATDWQVRQAEKKYAIRYLPEIDVRKFGYLQFLITVKFLNGCPKTAQLTEVFAKEPKLQLAMLTKGDFDLVLYLLAKDNEEASRTIIALRDNLASYESRWGTIPMYEVYGFIPIRDEFIDLLKDRGELLDREYAVLKELNKDGNVEFREIDKTYGFDNGRAQYSYHKLRQEGKIKRMTISLQRLSIRYVGIILKEITSRDAFNKNRSKLLSEGLEELNIPINKYLATYDITNPDGSISCVPVFDYDDLDTYVDKIVGINLGVRLTTLVVTNLLVGDFCYRRFDNAYSMQENILEEVYKLPKMNRINYEETGRKKQKEKYVGDIRGSRFAEDSAQ